MNRAKQAATITQNSTVAPPCLTDLPIDRRPLPLAHLRQRGGAAQTKRSRRADDNRVTDFEAVGAAAGTAPPAPPCSARTRSRGYLIDLVTLGAISSSRAWLDVIILSSVLSSRSPRPLVLSHRHRDNRRVGSGEWGVGCLARRVVLTSTYSSLAVKQTS